MQEAFPHFFVFYISDECEKTADPLYNTASLIDVVEKETKTLFSSGDLLIANQRIFFHG